MKLVKVKNFPDRMMAEQAQQSLKDEGIESLLQSDSTGITGVSGVGFLRGVDLYVHEEQADKAKEILHDLFGEV